VAMVLRLEKYGRAFNLVISSPLLASRVDAGGTRRSSV
jgi:hypothetical protein